MLTTVGGRRMELIICGRNEINAHPRTISSVERAGVFQWFAVWQIHHAFQQQKRTIQRNVQQLRFPLLGCYRFNRSLSPGDGESVAGLQSAIERAIGQVIMDQVGAERFRDIGGRNQYSLVLD